ncbi:uncharacterized protein LOC142493194 isoform X2 [Ascaphus truei]|uniref:uncharacterized protein LOC142493194 isoform X2 n=1 Tax=Ascaphus truei TaxID=8439 RepID=UPI003F59CEE5
MDSRNQTMAASNSDHVSGRISNDSIVLETSSSQSMESPPTTVWLNYNNSNGTDHGPYFYYPNNSSMKNSDVSVAQTPNRSLQDPRQMNYFANPVVFPHSFTTNITEPLETGLRLAHTRENLAPLHLPPSGQEKMFYMPVQQDRAQQDQLMLQQMEQLQKLVKEQQKIITLINPGLAFPPGLPSKLVTMMPNPRVPSASFSVEIPVDNSSQLPDQGSTETGSITMQATIQKSPNESSSICPATPTSLSQDHITGESTRQSSVHGCKQKNKLYRQESQQEEMLESKGEILLDSGSKTLSPVREEKDEEAANHVPLSPFGVRPRNGNHEERLIRPGIGERQKTFEDFVEEQLKVDSETAEKEQLQIKQDTCETKTSRKTFLKRREGISRFEKKCDNPIIEQRRNSVTYLSRRVSFDGEHRNSLPSIHDVGKVQLKNRLVLHRQVSSPSVMSTREKYANDATSKNNSTNKYDSCDALRGLQKQILSYENMQSTGETYELKPQTTQEITCKENATVPAFQKVNCTPTNAVPAQPKIPIYLANADGFEIGRTTQKGNQWQNSNENSMPKKDKCSDLEKWTVAITINDHNNLSADNKDPASKSGFKKVNDKIIKVTGESFTQLNRQINNRGIDRQRTEQRSENGLHRRNAKPLGETDSTSSDSDDDPKSHCYRFPSRDAPQKVSQVDKHLDLSDPDYASDNPSGEDEKKKHLKSSGKILSSQQDNSLSTSSSEHSKEDFRRRGSKAFSSFRKASFRHSRPARKEKEPDKKGECEDSTNSVDLQNPPSTCDIVACLFPALKTKTDLPVDLEPAKRSSEMYMESPLLAKMKEEQNKAMTFLRQQMDHFERLKADELSLLEEFKKEEIKKLQKVKEELEKQAAAVKEIKVCEKSEEIQMLKVQISELQVEFQRNESRWSSTHGQLRKQVEGLTKENQELRSELRAAESHLVEVTNNRSESLVSQAIMRGTSFTKSDQSLGQTVHRSRSSTPVGRKSPYEKLTSKESSAKVVSMSVHSTHRKSPVTVSQLSVFNDTNMSAHTKGRPSSQSGSSEDTPLLSLRKEDLISSSQNNNLAIQDGETPSMRQKIQGQQQSWEQTGITTRKTRSRSVTPSGRKTQAESTQGSEIKKNFAPMSVLSRRSLLHTDIKSIEEDSIQEETQYPDGKIEQLLSDGRTIITFQNGTKKEISGDGKSLIVSFFNGDVKKMMPDQSVIYYYADAQTTHTTYPNGLEVLEFPNKQIEKHHPEGTKEIVFPDRTVKHLYRDGREETTFPDGTIVTVEKNGNKTVAFINGQKEIHTAQFKRREYRDGTIKTVYSNGRQETKYSSGRVRIKDQEGNIILDKK